MAEPAAAHSVATSDQPTVTEATRAVATLNAQVDSVRAELARVTRDLAEAQRDFSEKRAAQLVEANEQLVLSALQAEAVAETAIGNLGEVTRASQRDGLTDTPNRALMLDRLEGAIALAHRRGTHIAVLFLDLDDFKQINDMHGHATGDAVLQLVARRLESVVRNSDTVSRHGGDEFLVLLAEIAHASDAAAIAEKMLAAVAAPCDVGTLALQLSASVGITIYPDDGEDAASLISRADAAMYRSKYRHPGTYTFHSEIASERGHEPSVPGARQQPGASSRSQPADDASRANEVRSNDLQEANEHLVIAAVASQEQEVFTGQAHRRQVDFLAMVAHELRNPLAPLKTASSLLSRAGSDAALLARIQGIIQRQVAHMSRLVDDLLDGSRVTAGKFRVEMDTVEMNSILRLCVETCRPATQDKQQHLDLRLPAGDLVLQGDHVRLLQIFTNLLENASKYTQRGGSIALAVRVLEQRVTVVVSDNGVGITAAALPHIFDLFVQDKSALTAENRGLGIGLAVVRDLVAAHGGSVLAKSPGRGLGSEFVVTLPRPGAARAEGG